jgi:nucleoside-diphosphate-sugar epimerase
MILVTGTTGLVGSHLVLRLIENGQQVRAIYQSKESQNKTKSLFDVYDKAFLFSKIEWVAANINDIDALENAFENITMVYHCAALISFDRKDENKMRKINIEGTANIVNFCLAYSVKKLCYVSSIAALGTPKEFEIEINESTDWNPEINHSDYAITKYGAELEVWRGQQEGLSIVIVNPGVVLGPGFWNQGSGVLFSKIKNGLSFYTEGTTGFVGVWDVVQLMETLMESKIEGERFILVSENKSYKSVINNIASQMSAKNPTIKIPFWLAMLLSWIDGLVAFLNLKKRTLTPDMVRSMFATTLISNEQIRTQFDFKFESIEDVIAKTITLNG